MAKRVGGKVPPKYPDNPLLSAYYAARKLSKDMASPRWKLSASVAINRLPLNGKPSR